MIILLFVHEQQDVAKHGEGTDQHWVPAAGLVFEQACVFSPVVAYFHAAPVSYFEGQCCELAKFGYSRDHRGDRKQVNYGIYSSTDGTPVGVEVLAGNESDRIAFPIAVERVRKDFNHKNVIFISDRGTISGKAIDEYLRDEEGAGWITALNSASIARLERHESIQLTFFDECDLASITHPPRLPRRTPRRLPQPRPRQTPHKEARSPFASHRKTARRNHQKGRTKK